MKNKIQILTLAALSSLTPAALADEAAYQSTNNFTSMMSVSNGMAYQNLGHSAKASDLMGLSVKNDRDETVGKVKDLAVDVEAGRILYVIVSAGGMMGIGGTLQAVPPGALQPESTNQSIRLDPEISRLDSQFEMAKWSDVCGSNRVMEIYGQYHQVPYFMSPEYTNLLAPRQLGQLNESGSMQHPPAYASRIEIVRASKVIGTSIVNRQGEKLGKVENLMVNIPAGRIVAVIVSSGGFMGIDGELSAVPPSAFRFNAETNNLQLDASIASLTNAPHFTSSQWPDMDQPTYAGNMYRAYSVTPYFNTNDLGTNAAMQQADNTARNMRDRNGGTLTPFDQGSSASDINTTAQIRKQIMARAGLSIDAQNIKIITRGGKVTLRGPVSTMDEKSQIGEIADGVAGGDNVDNQLEVKTTASN